MKTKTTPYQQGKADGFAWDLDQFENWSAVLADTGFADSSIEAIGRRQMATDFGIKNPETVKFRLAFASYARGIRFALRQRAADPDKMFTPNWGMNPGDVSCF